MLTLDKIAFEFSGRWLFQNASFQIKPGDRIGLVGRNGTGKTTLLRMITGEYTPTDGKISAERNTVIGFLYQELQSYESENTVFGVAMEAFSAQTNLKQDIDELLKEIETNPTDERLSHRLHKLQEDFEASGGYDMEREAATVLAGLGFTEQIQQASYNNLSGGWRMRVMLAKILLQKPDLLLLDEPTNHLDLPSIQWLETYLQNFRGALVIVSHDRYFLDRICRRILEISRQKFNLYRGDYSYFLKEKALRSEQLLREFENQQKHISETEKFINRFRAKASKAKQVQSKIKLLDKIERLEAPDGDEAQIKFSFRSESVSGKIVHQIDIENKSFGDHLILKNSTGTIARGDKIALIGANGLGKSTLLRMIVGTEEFKGKAEMGHKVLPSFYAQHQLEALDAENDVLGEMRKYIAARGEAFVRNVLGGFLFSGDDVQKKIKVLSGGEKSRVALAKTLLSAANFLMLDEPTNHLDIQSIQILIQALKNYEGTFIVVSHDRHFLKETANKIWFIQDHELKEYPGTYEEWEHKYGTSSHDEAASSKQKEAKKNQAQGKNQYREENKLKRKKRKVEANLEKTEQAVEKLETEKAELMEKMSDPEVSQDFGKLATLQKLFDEKQAELNKMTSFWEELVELQSAWETD